MKGLKHQRFALDEFIKHYKMAKKANKNGDQKTVNEFFRLYVTDED